MRMMERRGREGEDTPVPIFILLSLLTLFFFLSLFNRRDLSGVLPSLHPRAPYVIPISWCSPGTKTWVTVTVFNAYARGSNGDLRVLEMLLDGLSVVYENMGNGEGLVPSGVFRFASHGASWYSANANNHQQTWGVLAGAIMALSSFMESYGSFGYAHFEIFDGGNQVGSGSVGPG